MSIPEKVDGIIRLELNSKSKASANLVEDNHLSAFPIEYKKAGGKISFTDRSIQKNETPGFMHVGNEYIFYINAYIEHGESYEVTFCFFSENENYIPIARDKVTLRG